LNLTSNDQLSTADRWARLRFSIVGFLLAAPPEAGELQKALRLLAAKTWVHPVTDLPVRFAYSTLEKWFYAARKAQDPVRALRERPRGTAGKTKSFSDKAIEILTAQYRANENWTAKLLADNLRCALEEAEPGVKPPSYHSVRRFLKARGMIRRTKPKRDTAGVRAARERLDTYEVRSYEVPYVNSLWHADFHDGSRKVITRSGELLTPQLFGCIDDYSRLVCHLQWYTNEDCETFVHGISQALQRRGLPRSLMTDNGPAMKAAEFTEGLARVGITHTPTLEYSPHMNAKTENFWGRIEGRLMAMLQNEKQLTLELLNRATHAWVEREYQREVHSEIGTTPLNRYLAGPNVGRECPSSDDLRAAFRIQVKRTQRKSDGTVSLEGQRFEIPNRYRHLDTLYLRYARWDLRRIDLIDPRTDTILCPIVPLDKTAHADGERRHLDEIHRDPKPPVETGMAPLMRKYLAEYAATGLPPAFLPTDTGSKPNDTDADEDHSR
jgi:hypothetical protein